jgi:hypothetical protein
VRLREKKPVVLKYSFDRFFASNKFSIFYYPIAFFKAE